MMAFDWFTTLPIGEQIPIGLCAVGAGLYGLSLFFASQIDRQKLQSDDQRRRQEIERAYNRALLEFRWSEHLSPTQFEKCCADYLALMGWQTHTTKASGDQGVDVVAQKFGTTVVLQCKKYSKPVGNRAVQEVHAARSYVGASVAAVVSNQPYTPAARDLAGRTNVLLLHFTELRGLDALIGVYSPPHAVAAPRPQATNTPPPVSPSSARRAPSAAAVAALRPQSASPPLVEPTPPGVDPYSNWKITRRCPACQTKLRLPSGKSGIVKCPVCTSRFHATT